MELEALVSALPSVLTGLVTDYVGLKSHTFYTLPETDYVNVGTDYVSINTRNPFSVWTRQDFEEEEFPNGITDEQWEEFCGYAENEYTHLNEVGDHQIEMMRIVYPPKTEVQCFADALDGTPTKVFVVCRHHYIRYGMNIYVREVQSGEWARVQSVQYSGGVPNNQDDGNIVEEWTKPCECECESCCEEFDSDVCGACNGNLCEHHLCPKCDQQEDEVEA